MDLKRMEHDDCEHSKKQPEGSYRGWHGDQPFLSLPGARLLAPVRL
jgi:hypothetical protein